MTFDPYPWSKNRINTLEEKIDLIKNDGLKTSPGKIWSIKKLLILDYYVGTFVKIIRNHPKFQNWYYIDTHCGSGLITFEEDDLNGERFPGSPLIPAFRDSSTPFTDYFFFDEDSEAISSLAHRLSKLKMHVGNRSYSPRLQTFEKSVEFILSHKKFGNAFLIFVDPTGFIEVKWDLMEKLFSIQTADIFFTFMTPFITLNRKLAETDPKIETHITNFFGNENWRTADTGEELVELYISQVQKYKKYVFQIPVYQTGKRKLYDIIIATNSKGAQNIISDVEKIMDVSTTEMIREALRVVTNKKRDLTEWMN